MRDLRCRMGPGRPFRPEGGSLCRLARPAPVTGSAPAPEASSEVGADAEELLGTLRRCQLRLGLDTCQGAEGLSWDTGHRSGTPEITYKSFDRGRMRRRC